MAWELLPVDYTDAVWSGLKRYNQVTNEDGTVSFQDVTQYSNKEKSFFGALQANRMNEALNTLMSMVENGTDLYTAFQNYFAVQKELFEDAVGDFEADYQTEISQFENQQEALFTGWFESMKGQLSEDAAGNLQNQINAHAHTGEDGTVKVDAGNISNLADYIVEQGVSGIWTYRKWASGIIECWGQTDIGAVGITNTTGSQYYSATQYLDYPSLANQVDHVSLSAYSDVTVYTLSEYWLANSKIAYRLMTGYQVTTPDVTRVSVYVMGRWQQNA